MSNIYLGTCYKEIDLKNKGVLVFDTPFINIHLYKLSMFKAKYFDIILLNKYNR